MARFVAYYRMRSVPGEDREAALWLQRDAVRSFVAANGELIDEFIEDETLHQRRKPHFEAALTSARRHHAKLLVPRFRPIHRTAAFVSRLRDEGVDFVALDMPGASRATIASLAVAAARHRRAVSERIKRSLQAAKARGRGPGNPEIELARPKAVQAASDKAQGKRQAVRGEVVELRKDGRSLRAIADEFNRRGIPTARGREWHASSIRTILAEVNGLAG